MKLACGISHIPKGVALPFSFIREVVHDSELWERPVQGAEAGFSVQRHRCSQHGRHRLRLDPVLLRRPAWRRAPSPRLGSLIPARTRPQAAITSGNSSGAARLVDLTAQDRNYAPTRTRTR
jgi:hypothetical protein